jgi:hypothetical protein
MPLLAFVWAVPAMVGADLEPVYPGLSPDDVLTLYFTRSTNRPSVSSTAKVLSLLSFDPPLATVLRATWQTGPDEVVTDAAERLVISLSGVVNSDVTATLMSRIRVSVLRGGGLRDAENTCQNVSGVNSSLVGTWGDASQPLFLVSYPAVALDYGGQSGLGPGDAVLLRFNQPVAQVPVSTKALVDATLAFSPPTWADDYNGTWLDTTSLLVTVRSVSVTKTSSAAFRASTAVGTLSVAVLPGGRLTSYDGTSLPSNARTVVSTGSWGDVVCDGGLFVYSHTALAVAFSGSANASYVPSLYIVETRRWPGTEPSTSSPVTVSASQSVSGLGLPSSASAASLRFVLPRLTTGTEYVARVAMSPPELPGEVASVLPRAVPLVYTLLGSSGGCSCSAVQSGMGCASVTASDVAPTAPSLPVISTCKLLIIKPRTVQFGVCVT